jgi:hypothetical protein
MEEVMKPGHRDYNEREENTSRGGILDALGNSTHEGSQHSVLEKMHLGKGQEEGSKKQEKGGILQSLAHKVAPGENHRDATDSEVTDEHRLSGNLHNSHGDDAWR